MSQPSRTPERRRARRKDRQVHLDIQRLEERLVLAPVVTVNAATVSLANVNTVTVDNISTITGSIVLTFAADPNSAAPFTSVAQLTSLGAFGGDMVRIQAGPGGDFGKGVYAISRGAGDNIDPNFRDPRLPVPINRPGVIYRVDPVTGRSSVFFDLNTVLNQIDPGAPPGNGALPGTGLVNWYDIAFDPEGQFDGRPSMFVTSLSTDDPLKNVVYRIGSDGSFLGLYIPFAQDPATSQFGVQPSAIFVPPVEQQSFLRGVFVGNAADSVAGGNGAVLFFNANVFRPGQPVTGPNNGLGISATGMTLNPQVGITNANTLYASPEYAAFTDFGLPPSPITPPAPGLSGVQGFRGDILIGNSLDPQPNTFGVQAFLNSNGVYEYFTTDTDAAAPDTNGVMPTPFRRFQDIAFDNYSFFSYGATLGTDANGAPTTTPVPPTYAGSLFVTDLAQGLSANLVNGDVDIYVPVQGPGNFLIQVDTTNTPNDLTNLIVNTLNIGGRVVRIGPDGVVTPFATGFHTSSSQEADSFTGSTLSLTFSADGTTLYVADMDGIWQFKTVTSIAGSTTGSQIGLNDLRSFGVPYEGQDLAVAIVDTGVDSNNPFLRGRVAPGKNLVTNGRGDDDTAGVPQGHGTATAGVVTQFVPQATLVPVNVFTPNTGVGSPIPGGTNAQILWNGLQYITQNPYVNDPIRPNTVDRTVASNFGFGTVTAYDTEGEAYRANPQVVLALKSQFNRFRRLGIAPIAATGQFGTTSDGNANTTNGESLPAALNEVISVGGSYSFPYASDARSIPTDPSIGALPRPLGPVLVTDATGAIVGADLIILTAGDPVIFANRILANTNRSIVTDFVAPALNVPTYARTSILTTTTVGGTGLMLFQEGGTSISSAIVTGSFVTVASALDYWVTLANNGGVTVDGYLTTPVGVNQLNFGPHQIGNLATYLTPDGVNSILQWTAVPVRDEPTTLDIVAAPQLFPNAGGPYPERSRIDVGNAIAAIEGTIALNYLISNGYIDTIDSNHNGLITAQEIQTFVDSSATSGMAEAGALARFLGGTDRLDPTFVQTTGMLENPEQNDVLQRRYNFFDYAVDGNLDGVISVEQLRMLSRTLLPAPDAFVVVDRQRASGNGYLLDPSKERNYVALQYTKPKYAFVPAGITKRFRNISPQRFGVGLRQLPGTIGPQFTLFAPQGKTNKGGVNKAGMPSQVTKPTTPERPTTPTLGGPTSKPTTETPTSGLTGSGTTNSTTGTGTYQEQAVDNFLDRLRKALTGNNPTQGS